VLAFDDGALAALAATATDARVGDRSRLIGAFSTEYFYS
jgi:hypothetical protein